MANLKVEVVGCSEARDVRLVPAGVGETGAGTLVAVSGSERASLVLLLPTGEEVKVGITPEDYNRVHACMVKADAEPS